MMLEAIATRAQELQNEDAKDAARLIRNELVDAKVVT